MSEYCGTCTCTWVYNVNEKSADQNFIKVQIGEEKMLANVSNEFKSKNDLTLECKYRYFLKCKHIFFQPVQKQF